MVTALDIIVLAAVAAAFAAGRRRGLVKMLWRVFAWIVTAAAAIVFSAPAVSYMDNTQVVSELRAKIEMAAEERLAENFSDELSVAPESIAEITGIPQTLISGLNIRTDEIVASGIENAASVIAESVSGLIVRAAAFLALMILLRIVMAVLYRVLDIATKLPVIKGVNKMLGGLLGIINMMFFVYVVLAVASLCITTGSEWDILINNTYIVKYFYNNNILLHLINL